MGNRCIYEPMVGAYPNCDGACKKGKDTYCPYYYVDEVCTLLKRWMTEAQVETPLLIRYDYEKLKLIIYTTDPGKLIGYHGKTITKYSKLLNEKLRLKFTGEKGIPQEVDFIELVKCDDAVI